MNKQKAVIAIVVLSLFSWGIYQLLNYSSDEYQKPAKDEQPKNLNPEGEQLHNGDIIFQTSLSGQSKAIQLATNSTYSHCGIIYIQGNKTVVLEAVQPVKTTPLNEWIGRGKGGHYVVKRLIDAEKVLTAEAIEKMKREGLKHIGKNYDFTFEWSDSRIYCSELVWKIYKRATGLEIGKLQQMRDLDLSHPEVRKIMQARYGSQIPLDEQVISPAAVFDSELLMVLKDH